MDKYTLGFLLVLGAGLSTGIGSAVVYHSGLVVLASKEVLGVSLGLSAGVMLYVSFVEIFQKAVGAFHEDVGLEFKMAYFWATFCFFMGVVLIRLIDKLVHYLAPSDLHLHAMDLDRVPGMLKGDDVSSLPKVNTSEIELQEGKFGEEDESKRCKAKVGEGPITPSSSLLASPEAPSDIEALGTVAHDDNKNTAGAGDKNPQEGGDKDKDQSVGECDHKELTVEHVSLHRMGLFTALAIAIHNFPEGLATFVATLDDPSVGVALAVAIAIHNIPEGLCVSMPIYFATGNRHQAFLWGLLSGMSEILAAGLGWAILANVVDGTAYGILFGLVAGMMVAIVMYELLPTARKYDPADHYVSHSVIIGMLVMSISLVVFQF